jgi:hypothetical protein
VGGGVSVDSPGWFLSESCSLGCGEPKEVKRKGGGGNV